MSGHCTTLIGGPITVVLLVIRGVRCPVEVIGGRSLAWTLVITPGDGPGGAGDPLCAAGGGLDRPMRPCWGCPIGSRGPHRGFWRAKDALFLRLRGPLGASAASIHVVSGGCSSPRDSLSWESVSPGGAGDARRLQGCTVTSGRAKLCPPCTTSFLPAFSQCEATSWGAVGWGREL